MRKIILVKHQLVKLINDFSSNGLDKLPPERKLAGQFACSRATLGKALGILEAEKIVYRRHGAGTFITKPENSSSLRIALAMRNAYHCTDNHFRVLVDATQEYAAANGIEIKVLDNICYYYDKYHGKEWLDDYIAQERISGILLLSRMPLDIVTYLKELCLVVAVNNTFGDGLDIPSVKCDNFRVGFLATNYLLQNGHRKLAFICEEQLHPEAIYMFSGFKSAMEAADIVVTVEKDFLETMRNLNIFKKRVLNFFKTSSHTAWFVRNRTLASRIIAVLQNAGISIPAELSIITVESYVNGSNITAIDNRLEQGCQLGLDILKKNIINPQERQKQGIILLEPEFKKGNTVLEVDR